MKNHSTTTGRPHLSTGQEGFTLIEVLISIIVLMVISATALNGIMSMSKTGRTVANRTEMHAGVRNATELLQQEVGQAGRVTLPPGITVAAAVAADDTTFTVNSVTGLWTGQYLVVGAGGTVNCPAPDGCEETVMVKTIDPGTKTITIETDDSITKAHIAFWYPHAVAAPIRIEGGFAYGVVPKSVVGGSDDFLLKIFGDINGTGKMVYVEYWCDVNGGNLYRRSVSYTDVTKPGPSADQILLNNITKNPNNAACFVYQEKTVGQTAFVTDVAITLTVETATTDATTELKQKETKALLNVSPRNVFNTWQLAGQGMEYRVQPMPPSVANLMQLP